MRIRDYIPWTLAIAVFAVIYFMEQGQSAASGTDTDGTPLTGAGGSW